MVKIDEIKDKVKSYLQIKHGLDVASCYAVCKDLQQDYWDEWRNAAEIDEQSKEDFSEFETMPHISDGAVVNEIKQAQDNPRPIDTRNINEIKVV
jgi:hypothetical protein